MTRLQKAKREVELELQRRSARIESTVARMKSELTAPAASLGRFARSHPYESLIGLTAVGAAAMYLVLNRSRNGSHKDTVRGVGVADTYADVIAASLREAEKKGLPGDQALQAAIRAHPPVVTPPELASRPNYLRQLTNRALDTLTALAFEYATRWLSDLMDRRNRRV